MTENAAVPLLQVQGLNAWYGAAQILFDVSLQVGRGAVAFSFWGKTLRGASRTTLPAWAWAMCRKSAASSPTCL